VPRDPQAPLVDALADISHEVARRMEPVLAEIKAPHPPVREDMRRPVAQGIGAHAGRLVPNDQIVPPMVP
jgi:hypothetical protein